MTVHAFHRQFRQHFPDLGNPARFVDETLAILTREAHLDPVALDDALQVPDGTSTAEAIRARYGEAAESWARRAL